MEAFRKADLRVNLLLVFVNAVVFLFGVHESCYIALFVVACVWLLLRGKYAKVIKYSIAYVLLSLFSDMTIGVRSLTTLWFMSLFIRHLLIPISYTDGLTDASTGTLLAVFERLHLPKAAGISTVVLLRFLPTIGYEFQAIRNSLKFRNVGVTLWSTILHPIKNFECTIVPLLIRTTRIADELSDAAMVRGVRMTNKIVSFDEVTYKASDAIISILFSACAVLICLVDRFGNVLI